MEKRFRSCFVDRTLSGRRRRCVGNKTNKPTPSSWVTLAETDVDDAYTEVRTPLKDATLPRMGELLRQEPVPFLDTEDNSQLVYSLFLRAELALKESKDADSLLVHLLETKRDEFKAVISAMSCDYDEPLIVLLWINAKRGEFLLAEEQARHAVLHKKPRK